MIISAFVSALFFSVQPVLSFYQAPQTPPPPFSTTGQTVQGQGGTPLARGVAAYKRGEWSEAARELSQAVILNPDSPEAHSWLGFVRLKQGQVDEAVPHLERALALRPDSAEAATNLGNALLARPNASPADLGRAVTLFEQVARATPTSAQSAFNLGYAYNRAGKTDESARAYREATRRNPSDGKAWLNLGQTLLRQKNADAVQALREAVRLAPNDVPTQIALGSALRKSGDKAGAIATLEAARAQTATPDETLLTELARAYTDANRLANAAEAFGAAADAHDAKSGVKPDPLLRYNEGVLLAKVGKLDEASTAYDKVLAQDPAYFDALVNSGFVLFRQNKVDQAVARFQQATSVRPDSALAWANLAAANARKGDRLASANAWREAVARDKQNYEWREQLAGDLLALSRYEQAATVAKEMVKLRPQSADPQNLLGLVYQAQAEATTTASRKQALLIQALRAFEEAARRDPKSGAAYNNQGVIRERRGELPQAIAAYKKALQVEPTLTDAKRNLARFKQ
jgi:tetratricopeptide (TPR) repeat protein